MSRRTREMSTLNDEERLFAFESRPSLEWVMLDDLLNYSNQKLSFLPLPLFLPSLLARMQDSPIPGNVPTNPSTLLSPPNGVLSHAVSRYDATLDDDDENANAQKCKTLYIIPLISSHYHEAAN